MIYDLINQNWIPDILIEIISNLYIALCTIINKIEYSKENIECWINYHRHHLHRCEHSVLG